MTETRSHIGGLETSATARERHGAACRRHLEAPLLPPSHSPASESRRTTRRGWHGAGRGWKAPGVRAQVARRVAAGVWAGYRGRPGTAGARGRAAACRAPWRRPVPAGLSETEGVGLGSPKGAQLFQVAAPFVWARTGPGVRGGHSPGDEHRCRPSVRLKPVSGPKAALRFCIFVEKGTPRRRQALCFKNAILSPAYFLACQFFYDYFKRICHSETILCRLTPVTRDPHTQSAHRCPARHLF